MILITGVNGFIGKNLALHLIEQGEDVIGIDPSPFDQANFPVGRFFQISTLDKLELTEIFKNFSPKKIIHLGMTSNNKEALHNKLLARRSIIEGTANLLECAKLVQADHFLFASTSMVYGHFTDPKMTENHPCYPIEYYGALKLEAEDLIRETLKNLSMDFTIFRPTAVYGLGDNQDRVVQIFLSKAQKGEAFVIKGSTTVLDFTNISDVIKGIVLMLKEPKARNQVYNISRSEPRTLEELAQIIKKNLPDCQYHIEDADKTIARRGSLDIAKIQFDLGFQPQVRLEDGILQCLGKHHGN